MAVTKRTTCLPVGSECDATNDATYPIDDYVKNVLSQLITHYSFFVFALSITTAVNITKPFTTCCQKGDTFSNTSPLFNTPMITAPSTVPSTLPLPPDNEVPPMTTAAMESSS